MNDKQLLRFAEASSTTAALAAREYAITKGFDLDIERLSDDLKVEVKAVICDALDDAHAAISAGLRDYGTATFVTSMTLAGIAAAKKQEPSC